MEESTITVTGLRISESRTAKNLSQAEVCRIGGFHKASYSNWESGRRTPSLEDAKKLESVFNVSAAYILNLTDYPSIIGGTSPDLQYTSIPLYDTNSLEKPKNKWKPLTHIPMHKDYFGKIDSEVFAFVVPDNCMNSVAQQDDIILISPCSKPNHGDLVLIKAKTSSLVFLRLFQTTLTSMDKKSIELKSSNDSCPTITVEDESKFAILGIAKNMKRIVI